MTDVIKKSYYEWVIYFHTYSSPPYPPDFTFDANSIDNSILLKCFWNNTFFNFCCQIVSYKTCLHILPSELEQDKKNYNVVDVDIFVKKIEEILSYLDNYNPQMNNPNWDYAFCSNKKKEATAVAKFIRYKIKQN